MKPNKTFQVLGAGIFIAALSFMISFSTAQAQGQAQPGVVAVDKNNLVSCPGEKDSYFSRLGVGVAFVGCGPSMPLGECETRCLANTLDDTAEAQAAAAAQADALARCNEAYDNEANELRCGPPAGCRQSHIGMMCTASDIFNESVSGSYSNGVCVVFAHATAEGGVTVYCRKAVTATGGNLIDDLLSTQSIWEEISDFQEK